MNSLKKGFKDGIPIGLGYFAVAFSLGIIAASAGLTPFQVFVRRTTPRFPGTKRATLYSAEAIISP